MLHIPVLVGILFLTTQSLVRADVAHQSNYAYSATISPITNPGSSVPITIGDAGYTTILNLKMEQVQN
jgi:hypothetical protein